MEQTIQTLEDILWVCVIDFKGNWDDHLQLIESFYNSIYHSSSFMIPFKVLYGRRCRSSIGWFEVCDSSLLGPKIIYKPLEKVGKIRNMFKTSYSRQISYAQNMRRDLEFEKCNWVYLKIWPIKVVMIFGKKVKVLVPNMWVLIILWNWWGMFLMSRHYQVN